MRLAVREPGSSRRSPASSGEDPGRTLRRGILALLVLGMLGTVTELLLLGHTEDPFQWVPLAGLGVGLPAATAVAIRSGRRSVRVFQVVMASFVLMGFLGINRHYAGNVAFELELRPDERGLDLFREAMTGATPALAPGTMVLLGLMGLLFCFRHPALRAAQAPDPENQERTSKR